jgi:hypothetical protein
LLTRRQEALAAIEWESPEMNESERTNRPDGWQGQGPGSVEERRRILRSLGAGGAVAGLPSLAIASTGRPHCKKGGINYHPTASAVGSMIGSVTSALPMYGHPSTHYHTSANWGSWINGKGLSGLTFDRCASATYTGGDRLRFWQVMGFSSAPGTLPLDGSTPTDPRMRWCSQVLRGDAALAECVWLTALFNANRVGARFPYAPAGVVDLYFNRNPIPGGVADGLLHTNAITLFRDYLSSGMPT